MQTSSATKSSAAASAIIALRCRRLVRRLQLREPILHLCRVLSSTWALRLTASAPAGTSSSSFGGTEGHAVGVNLASGERLDPGGVHLIGITFDWEQQEDLVHHLKSTPINFEEKKSQYYCETFSKVPLAGLLGTACHPSSPPACPAPGAPDKDKVLIEVSHSQT